MCDSGGGDGSIDFGVTKAVRDSILETNRCWRCLREEKHASNRPQFFHVRRHFIDDVSQILSVRGDKLTVVLRGRKNTANRSGTHVWVIKASSKPRAWCKRDVPAGSAPEGWREARFPCDELLVHPDYCRKAMAEIVGVLDTSRRWHVIPDILSDCQPWGREEQRRMVALARSHRRVRELREQGEFVGLELDAVRARLAGIRAGFGVWNPEEDEESVEIEASTGLHHREPAQTFRRSPDSVPTHDAAKEVRCDTISVSNKTLLARRQLIRWWLRLKWLEQWLLHFPPDAMELLKQPFPSRRWHLMNLWLRVPASRDIFHDIPALAFAMASANAFRTAPVCRPLRSLRSLVLSRRKRLLGWLGFPATPLMLRLLRLARPDNLTMEFLFDLRRLLQSAPGHAAELVRLGKPLDRSTLGLVAPPILPTLPLLRALMDAGREERSLWFDSVRIAQSLHEVGGGIQRLPWLRSLHALKQTHDHLLALHRIHTQQIPTEIAERFPLTAPLPGNAGITPLTELGAVISESVRMNHCLDIYLASMATGRYFAYAIHLDGESATLGLRKDRGSWSFDQLQGTDNSPVSTRLRQVVANWLAEWIG